MDIKTKSEIIVDFVQRKSLVGVYDDFFSYNDLGIPLAVAIMHDLATPTKGGIDTLEETYLMLLTELAVDDVNKEYSDLNEVLEDSQVDEEE